MKPNYTYIILCLTVFTLSAQAKIWRVNNNPGVVADFTTLQAAHDGASAGDTIMLESSPTSYGSLTATKRIVIIGCGYLLNENYPINPILNSASVGQIIFESGSSGSVLLSVRLPQNSTHFLRDSNIIISRCYTSFTGVGNQPVIFNDVPVSNIIFYQNFAVGFISVNGGSVSNLHISNNLLYRLQLSSPTVGIVSNNILLATGSFDQIIATSQTLSNNILIGGSGTSFNGSSFIHNIDAGGSAFARFGTTNGNIGNLTTTQVNNIFLGATGNSTDGQWQLKAGSVAIGAGVNGVDCGMFGGETPYVLSGLPPIPFFTKIINTTQGSNATPLQVTVSVESKN
ncbi:MAG: hypothetical protein KF687_11060 [Cyclobacteriaceae bacterium]|nr:hypothetical protein [Cyclobacteriaceae bacterium]